MDLPSVPVAQHPPRTPSLTVDVVIPALDEAAALPYVLAALPHERIRRIVVSDNGSTDATAEVARHGGAEVVFEPRRGYGAACLKALAHLRSDPPDVVVFLDADFSDDPADLPALLAPLERDDADLVIGSRVRGRLDRGALTLPQRAGNTLACAALRLFYGAHYTDLGPFRAVRYDALRALALCDRDYGFTVELQIKAARARLRHVEVPVSYRRRAAGHSKVTGTVRGVVGASYKILRLLGRHAR